MGTYIHKQNGKIEYFEEEGELWFSYQEREGEPGQYQDYKVKSEIPKEIISQGKNAIRQYAQKNVEEEITAQKKRMEEHRTFANNPDFPVETRYKGVKLTGKIIHASDRQITVRLEQPHQGEDHLFYGWGSAALGHYMFEESRKFSKSAIESAHRLLIQIYERELYRAKYSHVIELKDLLNEED